VLLEIRQLSELDQTVSAARPMQATAQVVREARHYVLSLSLESGSGSIARELRSRDCGVVSRGAATLIALALAGGAEADSLEATTRPEQEPRSATLAPAQGVSAAPSSTDETPLIAPESPKASAREDAVFAAPHVRPTAKQRLSAAWVPWLSVGGGMLGNGLPGARPDLFGELGLDRSLSSLSLRLGHVFANSQSLTRDSSTRLSADFVALTGCGVWETGRWRAGPCLTVQGTRLHATSRGLVEARDRNMLWAQAGLGAAVRLRVRQRGQLGLASGFLLPLTARPRLDVESVGHVEQGSALSGYAHFDVGIRFD
jgi:hypothetical protein